MGTELLNNEESMALSSKYKKLVKSGKKHMIMLLQIEFQQLITPI